MSNAHAARWVIEDHDDYRQCTRVEGATLPGPHSRCLDTWLNLNQRQRCEETAGNHLLGNCVSAPHFKMLRVVPKILNRSRCNQFPTGLRMIVPTCRCLSRF